jgi:hypothetical protein
VRVVSPGRQLWGAAAADSSSSFADQHTTFESFSCIDGDDTVNNSSESSSPQPAMSSIQQIDESGPASLEISLPDSSSAEENDTAIQQSTSKEEEEIKEEFIEEKSFSQNNNMLCVRVESIRRLVKYFDG